MSDQSFQKKITDQTILTAASGGTGGTYPFEQYEYITDTGNLTGKAGVSYTYNAQVSGCQAGGRTIAHAVSAAGGNAYGYDCNGNMTQRVISGLGTYNLVYTDVMGSQGGEAR